MTAGSTVEVHHLLEGPEHAPIEQPDAVTQAILDHLSPVVREGR
jgi:hypothetical protein